MKRRHFLGSTAAAALCLPASGQELGRELSADVVIIGGSLGGCAAALAALKHGLRVILTEETDWIGGQLTSQGVPPDEHAWIETHGATKRYREFRDEIRNYYCRHYPLTDSARADAHLNPGLGSVSRLCHEPRVALAVLQEAMAPYQSSGHLKVLLEREPISAEVDGDVTRSVLVRSLANGNEQVLRAPSFVDATELGDLLPLTKTEYVCGAEGRAATGERHAPEARDPQNQQAFTVCFAMDHLPGESHVMDEPVDYAFWRDHVPALTPPWPGKLLDWKYTHPRSGQPKKLGFNPTGDRHDGVVNLWTYRRIAAQASFRPGTYQSDICLVNWPQNDYFLKSIIDVTPEEKRQRIAQGKQLSLSLLYWMQTEAPRLDGGVGFPGLRLRADIMGTEDGLAKYPYVRESRRVLAETTILESHCGKADREKAESYRDSVGIGYYPIDLHPSTAGDNYIDFDALPFQIPLGALLPQRMENVFPACKNIGATHVTNGCYRLHPVEWGIGEAVGCLLAFARLRRTSPRAIRANEKLLGEFQAFLQKDGVEIAWPATS
ncbi:MAG: hypothetical protein ACI8T1_003734 [Verrucomicrobiales bacterium]|jgi:hypothetical protein